MSSFTKFATVFSLILTTGSSAQTFRVKAEAVMLSAVVTDSKGAPVLTLKQEDFEVRDNQQPQDLLVFEAQNTPVDVAIVLDNSISMQPYMEIVRKAALRLLEKLRPASDGRAADRAMILFAGGRGGIIDLTGDIESLKTVLNDPQFDAGGNTLLYWNINKALSLLSQATVPEQLRKQVVVVLSDGKDTQSNHYRDIMLSAVKKSSATFYTLRTISALDLTRERNMIRADDEDLFAWKDLTAITGGRAFNVSLGDNRSMRQTLDRAFGDIADEFSIQYFLGFIPKQPGPSGVDRRLSVILKGIKGLKIRARSLYTP